MNRLQAFICKLIGVDHAVVRLHTANRKLYDKNISLSLRVNKCELDIASLKKKLKEKNSG